MRVGVFGVGYVGLVQGGVLAGAGHEVICIDTNKTRIGELRRGLVPFHEPGLAELVRSTVSEGRLHFSAQAAEALAFADIQIIAVGTPPDEDGSADLSHVLCVAEAIAAQMTRDQVVAVKSTVPVGSGDRLEALMRRILSDRGRSDIKACVVSMPEFLKEGTAVEDCTHPDRIIVGTSDPQAVGILRELLRPFNRNHERIIVMDRRSSELTKYAANCMLATRISLMNEIANLAHRLDADVEMVRRGIGSDPRIGHAYIHPGIGYGGSCFPKDVSALINIGLELGVDPLVLQAVRRRNELQKTVLVAQVLDHFGSVANRRLALWGLAFKPDTDDMREAPSRVIMEALWDAGAIIQAYDPVAMEECQRLYGERDDLVLCGTKEAALRNADALMIATDWKSFRTPNFESLAANLTQKVVFDGRNLYEPAVMAAHGFAYFSVGRPDRRPERLPAADALCRSLVLDRPAAPSLGIAAE